LLSVLKRKWGDLRFKNLSSFINYHSPSACAWPPIQTSLWQPKHAYKNGNEQGVKKKAALHKMWSNNNAHEYRKTHHKSLHMNSRKNQYGKGIINLLNTSMFSDASNSAKQNEMLE